MYNNNFLGYETVVDVLLHDDSSPAQVANTDVHTSQTVKIEPIDSTIQHESTPEGIVIKQEPDDGMDLLLSDTENFLTNSYSLIDPNMYSDSLSPVKKGLINLDPFKKPYNPNNNEGWNIKLEVPTGDHDYCQEDAAQNISGNVIYHSVPSEHSSPSCSQWEDSFNNEHSYCRSTDISFDDSAVKMEPIVNARYESSHLEENKLRFGLDESYFENVETVSRISFVLLEYSIKMYC